MTIELERVNNVPLYGIGQLDPDLQRWLLTLVDSLNTTIGEIEAAFALLPVTRLTAAQIGALGAGFPDGVMVYDTTNDVYVGKENGNLVKFDTSAYP
jgi:hypothetical protein